MDHQPPQTSLLRARQGICRGSKEIKRITVHKQKELSVINHHYHLMLDCKAESDFLHLNLSHLAHRVWIFQCSLQLGVHCQYLCGDMLAVEKWTSLLETRQLEAMPLGESVQLLRANNNRCIRFSSKAHKIREHLMLHLCIQALIHSHMSPFQHRHLSESWQQIRRYPPSPLTGHVCFLLNP